MEAVIGGVGSVVGGLIASKGSKDAAETQAESIDKASQISEEAAAQARLDVLQQFDPGLTDFIAAIQKSTDVIRSGESDIFSILQSSTKDANRILAQTGSAVSSAILGRPITPAEYSTSLQSTTSSAGANYLKANPDVANYYRQNKDTDPNLKGLTEQQFAEKHYQQYGQSEGRQYNTGANSSAITANDYFAANPDVAQYYQQNKNTDPALSGVSAQQFAERHYQQYGAIENRNTGTVTQQPTIDTGGQTGFAGASAALDRSRAAGLDYIAKGTDQAIGYLNPYAETGGMALNKEAALSGTLGAEAQKTALAEFMESPGQKYLREKQEQALLRNSAAIGGLGGGNVRTALQEQAMGIAATDQQRTLENFRNLATRGQAAAGVQGDFAYNGGQSSANLEANYGANMSGLSERTGFALAEAQKQTGQGIAGNTQSSGINLSEIARGNSGSLANLTAQGGAGQADIRAQLATILANLGMRQGTNATNLQLRSGNNEAAEQLGQSNALQQTVSGLAGVAGNYFGKKSLNDTNFPTYEPRVYDPKSY